MTGAVPDVDLNAPGAFDRYDETPDAGFYEEPRYVTHIDDAAIDRKSTRLNSSHRL